MILDLFRRKPMAVLQRLDLKPGDGLILLCESRLSPEQFDYLRCYVKRFIEGGPDAPKALVLDAGMKVAIISRPATDIPA